MKRFISANGGFTLLEILIVVALTVIVLGLIFGPVVSSFNFTRRAEVMVRAQDNARLALEQVSRDLADAMYVYDNTRNPINFPVVKKNGGPTVVRVYYAKVDLVLPRMCGYCTSDQHPSGEPKEFPRHQANPLLDEAAPRCQFDGSLLELRPVQPLAPDTTIVRYFIGLRDPSITVLNPNPPPARIPLYANGYTRRLATAGGDNMYVLYRAEFSPYDDKNGSNRLFPPGRDPQVNLADPNFFYNDDQNGWPGNETYAQGWKKISRPLVTLEDTDLITLAFDGNGDPIVSPTVKFMPTAVYNDPMSPTTDGSGDPEHGDTAAAVYQATYGHWVLPYEVTLFRKNPDGSKTSYMAARSADGSYMGIFDENGQLVFHIDNYLDTRSGNEYGRGDILPANPRVAFIIDPVKGEANFAFPVVNKTLSDQASQVLGGRMAVSKLGSTDDINAAYESATYRDRYRRFLVNDPADTNDPVREILWEGRVVPGSEKVVAPCATPGSSYGKYVLYSRTPFYCYEPAVNQYKLDMEYPESSDGTPALGVAAVYFHSHQTQEPGSGVPLPPGKNNVFVFYQVQNNHEDDTLRANYVTKSLMTVTLGIRMYDPSSGKAENIELTNKIRLRNVAA